MPERTLLPILLLMTLITSGCTWRVHPPASVADPARVYLLDYGRHSSIVMPAPNRDLVEYAFGDWNWFAANKNDPFHAIGALFFSGSSTLGRRFLQPVADINTLVKMTGAHRGEGFDVSAERAAALAASLDQSYRNDLDTKIFNPRTGLDHVRSDEPYGLIHNCNSETAKWLRSIGCDVDGTTLYSHFKVIAPAAAAHARDSAPHAAAPGRIAGSLPDTPLAPAPPREPPEFLAYHPALPHTSSAR